MRKQFIVASCLAVALCMPAVAFADVGSESAVSANPVISQEEEQALWDLVDEKAQRDGAVCEDVATDSSSIQPSAKVAKRPAKYPIAKGFILVTKDKYKGVVPTGHAGIIYSENVVIEAMPEGVVKKSNKWYSRYKTCYGAYVKNTTQAQKNKAANWAKRQLGKPYNYSFYNVRTRKAFYCSQLVWAAYKDTLGIDLQSNAFFDEAIHPSELLMTGHVKVFYKQQ